MKPTIILMLVILGLGFLINLGGCSTSNVNDIKAHAPAAFRDAGFDIVGYEGYQVGNIFESPGGRVWFTLHKTGNTSILYDAMLTKWGQEYHIYCLKAMDAIAPKN